MKCSNYLKIKYIWSISQVYQNSFSICYLIEFILDSSIPARNIFITWKIYPAIIVQFYSNMTIWFLIGFVYKLNLTLIVFTINLFHIIFSRKLMYAATAIDILFLWSFSLCICDSISLLHNTNTKTVPHQYWFSSYRITTSDIL